MPKIMVVEDDQSLREIYSIRLTAEGYELVSAGDGEEALAVAVKEKPDLILSDVMMPKISGFDMLDILRSTPETKNIKVIMMTALSSDDQRKRGENLGADKYLVKSQVGIEDVIAAVKEILGGQTSEASAEAPAPVAAEVPTETPASNTELVQAAPTNAPVAPAGEVPAPAVNPNIEAQVAAPQVATVPSASEVPSTPVAAPVAAAPEPVAAASAPMTSPASQADLAQTSPIAQSPVDPSQLATPATPAVAQNAEAQVAAPQVATVPSAPEVPATPVVAPAAAAPIVTASEPIAAPVATAPTAPASPATPAAPVAAVPDPNAGIIRGDLTPESVVATATVGMESAPEVMSSASVVVPNGLNDHANSETISTTAAKTGAVASPELDAVSQELAATPVDKLDTEA